jgi:hypothetical protein
MKESFGGRHAAAPMTYADGQIAVAYGSDMAEQEIADSVFETLSAGRQNEELLSVAAIGHHSRTAAATRQT